MTNGDNCNHNQKHQAFYDYLIKKFDGNVRRAENLIDIAEHTIPGVLNSYFGRQVAIIYEIDDINELEEYRKKIKTHPVLKNIDINSDPRYTDVLRWYILYMRHTSQEDIPSVVQEEEEDNSTSNDSEGSIRKPVTISTIFSEGEYGETDGQDKEFRIRNMKLRKACIEYFKQIHDGHIICECCGFDYTKAYKIDDEYIEIHHRFPFAHTEGEHLVNAATDLVPLCANCHRMIHHGQGGKGKCMSVEELKQIYIGKVYRSE